MWNENLSHRQTVKAQVSLHIHTVSSEPSLFQDAMEQEIASDKDLAPSNDSTGAFEG